MEETIIICLCLVLNAVLAAIEMAFVTVAKPRLRGLAREGHKEAKRVLALRENPERTLSVIQVGITVVGAIAAAVGGAGAQETIAPYLTQAFKMPPLWAEWIAIIGVVVPISFLNVVFGELVPKTLAIRSPLDIVLRAGRWLELFDQMLAPLVSLLEWTTKKVLWLLSVKTAHQDDGPEEEFELDDLSFQARQYVLNLVSIEQKRVRDVFLPWNQVNAVKVTQSFAEVEAVVLASGHTRLPVLKDDFVQGVLNTKEFITLIKLGETDWERIVRPMVKVLDTDPLLKVLRLLQEKRSHLATVYSASRRLGIVTMEDIIEEVIGDVFDEDDDGALKHVIRTGATFKTIGPRIK